MGDGKYLCTFLKNKKMGAPNSPQSSEMAHREAKTEYLGAYNFFTPVSSGNLPYGPLATPEKAIREFSFLIYPPGGEILCKKSPPGGNFPSILS